MKWKGDEEEKKDSSSVDGTSSTLEHQDVYVQSDDHGWVPARFVRMTEDGNGEKEAVVIIDRYESEQTMLSCGKNSNNDSYEADIFAVNLREYPGGILPLQNVNQHGDLVDYEDMVDLPYLHEAGILYNLKLRHKMGKPYTRAGDIVVAVNPYQWFDKLYQPENQSYYAEKLLWNDPGNEYKHAPKDLPPHVYETSTLAYKGMAFGGMPQSILITGESGAGKTETVKILQRNIAKLQQGPCASPDELEDNQVVKRVLDSNSLLEAFGNAQTRRNDNSSRFGKYTQLQFARQSMNQTDHPSSSPARLVGSTCEVYLLEKSRVVHDATNERNFHIFYELLAAPAQEQGRIWEGLVGKTTESFSYLGSTPMNSIEGASDRERFFKTVKTLEFVGISGSVLKDLFRSLCIVLQLGNIVFKSDPEDADKAIITTELELQQLAALMGLSGGAEELRVALTERTMKTSKEVYKVPLTAAVAKDSCDALAKDIYEKVFLWLVWMINLSTCAEHNFESNDASVANSDQKKEFGLIGLLDIFGFEAYRVNGYEQLLINYSNEKLQYKFTEDCFRLVEEEYKLEGVSVEQTLYDDNSDVLNLIEGKTGLLALLNEECWRPRGNSTDFVNKALHQHGNSSWLIENTMDRLSFGIHHFAGKVLYDADHFVRLNQDRLASDLKECATKMTNSIIAGEYAMAMEDDIGADNHASFRSANSNLVAKTVWTKYKTQLSKLMASLKSTECRYVRCIKPNGVMSPLELDHTLTINQLRSCGVVSSVTISRSAFPNRMLNSHVLSRFGGISHRLDRKRGSASEPDEEQRKVDALLSLALKSKHVTDPSSGVSLPAFVVGKSKTFFRSGALEYLEAERMTGVGSQAVIAIQRCFRAFLKRKDSTLLTARVQGGRKDENQSMAKEWRARNEAKHQAKKQQDAKRAKELGKKDKSLLEDQLRQSETNSEKRKLTMKEANTVSSPADYKPIEPKAKVKVTAKKTTKKRQERAPMEEEAKVPPVAPVDDELAELQAEMVRLRSDAILQDREADKKVKDAKNRLELARTETRKLKRALEDHADNSWREERSVKREISHSKAVMEEREKLIEQLKKEQQRLGKVFARTQNKKEAIEANNKALKKQCKEKAVVFKTNKQQSIQLVQGIDDLQTRYKNVKSENSKLHELVADQADQFALLAQAKLELQNTMAKILDICVVQGECKDKELRASVIRLYRQTSREAYKQMQVVSQLKDAKPDVSVPDFNQSWVGFGDF